MRQERVIHRVVERVTTCVIAAGALAALAAVYAFSQHRFFTIDEYQYGHATWLVAQGQIPYRDFFEHHFPLSYLIHAPFLGLGGDSAGQALLLRKLVFATLAAAAAVTGWTSWHVTGSGPAGLLTAAVPATFGFSLMSAVDYRADGFGAFYWVAALALLEWNRERDSRFVAALAGVLAFVAAGMTQKIAFAAGVTLIGMLAADAFSRHRGHPSSVKPLVRRPATLVVAGLIPTALLVALAAGFGVLEQAFEATVTMAAQHEALYEPFSLWGHGYVGPFLRQTWASTVPMLAFAVGFLATREGRFWLLPMGAAALGSALVVAPYPYNFVLVCWLGAMAAVRGFHLLLRRAIERFPGLRAAAPLLWVLPLAACLHQMAFVEGTTSNAHQLEILSRIERFGERTDAVIDNAGGAMFNPDASYYFYNGNAHRELFGDYFRDELVRDYRQSGALFWIKDLRSDGMPAAVTEYLESHYVSGGGNLHTLGFLTPAADSGPVRREIDVIRPGHYHVHLGGARSRPDRAFDLRIDGEPALRTPIFLAEGRHRVTVLPESPPYILTLVPGEFFDFEPSPYPYSMMFEYAGPTEGMRQVPVTGQQISP